ncbi:hypothetical protein [Brachyspira hampsonii]|uniref:hypothetical protein n=1 Tax=Brachyspira hampsonii TaxID=1287055 RepID=UPI000D3A62DB|nr:hypothetical protein [Brachyspira hampsonii]PTY40816.1 hypothetical protein DQ06_09725 [Brachyspira hampsonii bv. II]
MKKIHLLFLAIISMFIMSCGGHFFNPGYYYNRSSSSSDVFSIAKAEPPAAVPADEDPFKVKSEFNSPSYGGYEASQFDSWLFKASFRKDKLPIYNFFNDNRGRYWIPGGKDWNEIPANYYKPDNGENEASGYDISSMTVYKYDKDNPLYDDNGYLPGRMDRFRFYSIQGTAVIADLKQYLIAVDTYSKFVFAFGKITETESVAFDLVPTKFDALEYYGNKIAFYEYDPIGYVDISGEVVFYQHYIDDFVANPTGYFPKQAYKDYAQHDPAKPGKSPYYPLNDNTEASEEDKQKYEDAIKTYFGDYEYRDYSGYKDSGTSQLDLAGWKNGGYAGKSLVLYTYDFSDIDTLIVQEEKFGDLTQGSQKTYNLKMINTSYKATYVNAADPEDTLSVSIVENDSGVATISIGGNVLDKNFKDYGPIFTDRVMGATFKGVDTDSIKDLVYKFNDDGTEFTLTYQEEYWEWFEYKWRTRSFTYTLSRFDNDPENNYRAAYGVPSGTSGTVGDIRHGWAVFENNNNDIIKVSESYGTIITPGSGSSYGYDGHRE